jgi:hypothetical protein
VKAPPFGTDGHLLFSSEGIPLWTPMVDDFLKAQNLVVRAEFLPAPVPPKIPPPPDLSVNGRQAFTTFLGSAPHKAFAISPNGAYGWTSGRRTIEAARTRALSNCATEDGCHVVVVDDAQIP